MGEGGEENKHERNRNYKLNCANQKNITKGQKERERERERKQEWKEVQ